MARIITVSGQAQHGKDTFAGFLKEELESQDKKCLIIHFADYLKFICKEYYGWNGKKDCEGRTLLQRIGTDIGRSRNENIWTNIIMEFLKTFEEDFDFIIIPDTRFRNEIELLSMYFEERLLTVQIVREGFDNGLSEEQRNHKSERDLDGFTFQVVVSNSKDLYYLKELSVEMVGYLVG